MESSKTALVLGATGGIGGEVARQLRRRGWHVRALNRNPDAVRGRAGLDWVRGDAMVPADAATAAEGASLIFHGVNPPGYRNWAELVLPMLDSTIAAARTSGAAILFPGTVYNFGPDSWPVLRETSPQHPRTRKGAIRVEMERRLRAAAEGGTRVLIVRAGDFFGPQVANSWFSQGLVKPGQPLTAIRYPGASGVGHQWAYLPDVAETMIRLVEHPQPEAFASFHTAGHWDADGTRMIAAIRRAAGNPRLPVRGFPWPMVRLASPVVPLFRELAEMRYLWEQPIRMANDRLVAAIGEEPRTPLDEAVRSTLAGLGVLPTPDQRAAA